MYETGLMRLTYMRLIIVGENIIMNSFKSCQWCALRNMAMLVGPPLRSRLKYLNNYSMDWMDESMIDESLCKHSCTPQGEF